MFWKFWKRKRHKIEDLVNAIGHFPNLTEVTEEADRPESEVKPNPLLDLIREAHTIDELWQLYAKYEDSPYMSIASSAAFMYRDLKIRLDDLQERVSALEKKMEKGDG